MAEAMVVRYRQKYMQDNLVNPPVDVFCSQDSISKSAP